MKLFLLTRDDNRVNYDEYNAKLIRAEDETEARTIADQDVGDEGKIWQTDAVKCEVVSVEGKAECILASYNAG